MLQYFFAKSRGKVAYLSAVLGASTYALSMARFTFSERFILNSLYRGCKPCLSLIFVYSGLAPKMIFKTSSVNSQSTAVAPKNTLTTVNAAHLFWAQKVKNSVLEGAHFYLLTMQTRLHNLKYNQATAEEFPVVETENFEFMCHGNLLTDLRKIGHRA